ncbi:MAG: hypothetical protein AB8F95_05070, partial [Bacteroidia bacterium]
MMKITFTRFLLFGFAMILWSAGAYAQTVVTAANPYEEDFDSFTLCSTSAGVACPLQAGWTNLASADYDWRSKTGRTTSSLTGPSGGFGGSGNYLLTETSSPITAGSTFEVESPAFDFSALSDPVLSFYYHLYGSAIGTFEVTATDGTNSVTVFTITGSQQANEAAAYTRVLVDLNTLPASFGNTVNFRFKHTTVAGNFTFEGDAAFDQVEIFNGDLKLNAITGPVEPTTGCVSLSATETITVEIQNFGSAIDFSLNPVTFAISGTGTPAPSGSFTLNTGTIAPLATTTVNVGTADLSADGTYTIDVSMSSGATVLGTASAQYSIVSSVSSFPYSETFENGSGGWKAQGNTSFAIGTPSAGTINTNAPGGGTNSWATNPSGLYSQSETGAVNSPCFDFTSLTTPFLNFDAWWHSESGWDGTTLQYSTNGGTSWTNVGSASDANWYNDISLDGRPGGSNEGWAGIGANGSQGWVNLTYDVPFLAGESNVIFRFAFGSDGSVQYDGFAFDNFGVANTPVNEVAASAVELSSICPGTRDILVTVTAGGTNPLSSVVVSTTINGVAASTNQTINLNPPLTRGQSTIVIAGSGVFNSVTTYDLTATVSSPSGQPDENSTNDNTSLNGIQLKSGGNSVYPYFEGFENGTAGWEVVGSSSFELGTPDGATFDVNAPGGGTNSWVTNADGPYNSNENGSVVSPCFDFSNVTVPALQFDAWWDGENSWDGCVLQYSTNGGQSWSNLGEFQDTLADNWFNDNSLDGRAGAQNEGWSAPGLGDWTAMEYDISFMGGESSVVFRFAFGSDGSVQNDGFAFDNWSIREIPPEDASISFIDPASICPGTSDVFVTVQNLGSKRLSTVTVDVTVNGNATSLSGRKFRFNPPLSRGTEFVVNVGSSTFVEGTNYTINATTSSPNGRPDLDMTNDANSYSGVPSLNGTFSVGGTGADYADLDAAITALNTRGVCGPVVFNIAAGTYAGPWTIDDFTGASATNTVTFQSAGGTVVLEDDNSNGNYVVIIDGADHLTFKDLTISNTSTGTTGRIVVLEGLSENITIEGCILNTTASTTFGTTSIAAVYQSTSAADIVDGFTFRNNVVNGASYGLHIYGSTSGVQSDNLLVEDNTFNVITYGVYFPYTDNAIIRNNEIMYPVGNTQTSQSGGIYTFNNQDDNTCQHEITGNKIVVRSGGTQYGIYSSGNINRNTSLIANNMISCLDNSGTSTTYGIASFSSAKQNVYHNSIYFNSGSPTFGRGIYFSAFGDNTGGMRVLNNNVANFGGGLAIEINGGTPTDAGWIIIMNFNNWYTTGTNIGEYAGAGYADIAGWNAATSLDSRSLSVNPKYNDEADLHANSILIDAKGTVGLIAEDIDGDVRCPGTGCPGGTSAPDMGADEFEVPPIDLAPAMVVSPIEGGFGCNQSAATPVVIQIDNNGSQMLDFSVNPATVSWTTGSQSGTLSISTGTIAVGASMNVTVDDIDLSVAGTYVFDVTATVVGDLKTTNDVLIGAGEVVSRDAISTLPYVETFDDFPTCSTTGGVACPLPISAGWTNETNDDIDWTVDNGPAGTSSSTGPNDDFSRGGNYLYIETSGPATGARAILTSPCMELPSSPGSCPFFTFAYHMNGLATGSLTMEVNDGNGWNVEFFALGQQQPTEDSPWRVAAINLSAYSGTARIRFIGVPGTSFTCDI